MGRLINDGRHLPYDPDLKPLARKLRNQATPQENKLWYQFLRLQKFHFYRQKPVGRYIADFYCPKLKLIIELDGMHHQNEDQKNYDDERTMNLKGFGVEVVRFTNAEIEENFHAVCRKITQLINNPLYPKGDDQDQRS